MMNTCLPNVPPDSLTGAVLALEGISDAAVILNGPTGCKFFHAAMSEVQYPRDISMDPLAYSEEFYFGQPRVPATYLDGDDYIFGSADKLERAIQQVSRREPGLLAVVNSPGAALIGDDLPRFLAGLHLSLPSLALESTGFSGQISDGFQQAARAAVQTVEPVGRPIPGRVNLIGLSIYHKYWEGSLLELRRLLELCGLQVGCALCAGASVDALRRLPQAALNIVVHEEYADQLAPWIEQQFGTPCLWPTQGAPIGFSACESWIQEVAVALHVDPAPALAHIQEARRRSFGLLARFNSLTGLPKGATFALQADPSLALPLTRWLHGYLGMLPAAVRPTPAIGSRLTGALHTYLEENDCLDAWHMEPASIGADILLADGNTIAQALAMGWAGAGVEVSLPARGYLDIVPKALLGPLGALHILEQIVNALYPVF